MVTILLIILTITALILLAPILVPLASLVIIAVVPIGIIVAILYFTKKRKN